MRNQVHEVTEEWRPVVGYEGWYSVSSLGRVRREKAARGTRAGKILKPIVSAPNGYPRYGVRLWRDGESLPFTVHALVCVAFHGQKPSDAHEAVRWDGDWQNNAAANVRWATPAEYAVVRLRRGSLPHGEDHCRAKLTAQQAQEVRRRWAAGEHLGVIADAFGVQKPTISRIGTGKRWPHLAVEASP